MNRQFGQHRFGFTQGLKSVLVVVLLLAVDLISHSIRSLAKRSCSSPGKSKQIWRKVLCSLSVILSLGVVAFGSDGPLQPLVIVDGLDWQETSELDKSSPEYRNGLSVALLKIPGMPGGCTAFLINKDTIMTAGHCVQDEEQAEGVTAIFNFERGVPVEKWETYLCDGFLGTWGSGSFSDVDITLLKCKAGPIDAPPAQQKLPGEKWGVVQLSKQPFRVDDEIYVLHQNCVDSPQPPYSNALCGFHEAFKKLSRGRVIETPDPQAAPFSFTHTADVLVGSSGSPVFNRKHQVIGINTAELGGVINCATALNTVPPQANAGPDQVVNQATRVQLDGSKSIALFGPLRFAWRIVQKPPRSQARLSNPIIPNPTFTADREGEYILELKVRDRRDATATDRVMIKAIAMDVAFVSVRDGYYEIYATNSTGTRVARLTNNPYADWHVKWSPDGRRIAFASDKAGNFDIYVMNADGTNWRRLTTNPANEWCPSWSPDGRKIAFILNESGQAIPGKRRVYVMNANGTGRRQLTHSAGEEEYRPSWSPDGRKIAFTSNRDGEWQIYVMDARGEGYGLQKLTSIPGGAGRPAWSPHGSKIAFDAGGDIWVMNADGSGQVNLTRNGHGNGYPAWSPTGSMIIFQSHRDGNAEIYVMNADGSGQTNLTNNPANDWEPDWRSVSAWPTSIPAWTSPAVENEVRLVPTSSGIKFAIDGQGIADIQVEVYDLKGRQVFDSGKMQGSFFIWNLQNNTGQWLANGVYLYVITYRRGDGTILKSEVKKLVILR